MKCVCEVCGWEGRFFEAVYGFDVYSGPHTLWIRLQCPSCEEASKALLFGPEGDEVLEALIEEDQARGPFVTDPKYDGLTEFPGLSETISE